MSRTSTAMMLRRSWEWSADRIAGRVQVAAVVADGAVAGAGADTMGAAVATGGMAVTEDEGKLVVCGRKFAIERHDQDA